MEGGRAAVRDDAGDSAAAAALDCIPAVGAGTGGGRADEYDTDFPPTLRFSDAAEAVVPKASGGGGINEDAIPADDKAMADDVLEKGAENPGNGATGGVAGMRFLASDVDIEEDAAVTDEKAGLEFV